MDGVNFKVKSDLKKKKLFIPNIKMYTFFHHKMPGTKKNEAIVAL